MCRRSVRWSKLCGATACEARWRPRRALPGNVAVTLKTPHYLYSTNAVTRQLRPCPDGRNRRRTSCFMSLEVPEIGKEVSAQAASEPRIHLQHHGPASADIVIETTQPTETARQKHKSAEHREGKK